MTIRLEWPRGSGRIYTAERFGAIARVTAKPGRQVHTAIAGEIVCLDWLCDRSLRRPKARQLLAAALCLADCFWPCPGH